MNTQLPLCLVILDGFGVADASPFNAITTARTPTFDFLKERYSYTTLRASGESVGLPAGYVGNSEVGHITIGAGRVIVQPLTRINNAITDGSFFHHPVFDFIKNLVQKTHVRVHIMGLLSDVGVHGHTEHFFATLRALSMHDITDVMLHPILDGRDAAPCSASHYLEQLQKYMSLYRVGTIGTLHGRLYAMDRDKNWDRTKLSYDVLTTTQHSQKDLSWRDVLALCGAQGISEEFLKPVQLLSDAILSRNDIFLFLNYREDRVRQLAKALTDPHFHDFERCSFVPIHLITPIAYELIQSTFFYKHEDVKHSLKEVCSDHDKKVTVVAETEKFAHVTYFLSGGQHNPFPGETQILIPSLKYERYDEVPAMQAAEITRRILEHDQSGASDVYIVNYANADMVGHSGNFEATVQAIEVLDAQIRILYDYFVKKRNGILLITADHGKAESLYDPTSKKVVTGHTTNPVPFFFVTDNPVYRDVSVKQLTELKDIAPFVLSLLKIPIPLEMRN